MSGNFDGSTVLEFTGSFGLTDSYTHVCWFKATSYGAHRSPFNLGYSGGTAPRSYVRYNQDNNKMESITTGASGARYVWMNGQPPSGQWRQMIVRKVNEASDTEMWVDGIKAPYASGDTLGTFDFSAINRVRVGGLDLVSTYICTGKIAEIGVWDEALSDTDVNSLIALDTIDTVNPTALVSHWPLYDSLTDYNGTNDLSVGIGAITYDINDHPLAAPDGGPLFVDPSPLEYKIGATLVDYDMGDWFSAVAGTLSVSTDQLPSGISATGNLLNGTFNTVQDIDTTATGTDDNGNTDGVASWYITSYDLVFAGTRKLEDTAGSPYSGTVNFSAYKGTIDGGLTGAVLHFNNRTVTDGVVTLTHASLTSDTWTVLAQDNSDSTVLGIYEMTPE